MSDKNFECEINLARVKGKKLPNHLVIVLDPRVQQQRKREMMQIKAMAGLQTSEERERESLASNTVNAGG